MLFGFLAALSISAIAQVTTIPAILQKGYTGEVQIIFNPNEGNKGMVGASQCYAHTGITIGTELWQHASSWRDGKAKYKMTKNTDGNWVLTMPNGLYAYYGVPTSTNVTQLDFVFNDGPNGTKEGKTSTGGDIFVDLAEPGLIVQLQTPADNSILFIGDEVTFRGFCTDTAHLVLTMLNEGQELVLAEVGRGVELTYAMTFEDPGDYEISLTAQQTTEAGTETKTQTIHIVVVGETVEQTLPDGIELGINYSADPTKVTLCTFAAANKVANKPNVLVPAKAVFVVGDFNNWQLSSAYQMYRDSCHFWLPIEGLVPQREYAYQYVVIRSDGRQKWLSDGFAPKQLHKDDQYEPKTVDPTHYRAFPAKANSGAYASVLQTNKPEYEWSDATLNFVRPDKNNLVIYEMWVYDYTASRSFEGVFERLDYLQNLGVNAIEFMPLCEFDGNYNWGYSPNHYFAVDKAYGSSERFKQLVDSLHSRGMAVIVDMVFNHATGLNPQNMLYPYGEDLKWNPWFNTNPPHGDNVYEDWNHDFPETRKMFTRALNYWLDEYKVDGFRMDLSHGFCGKTFNPYTNISHYYQNAIVPHNAYFILEHWGSDGQGRYIEDGMLCWTGQGLSDAYSQLAMGQTSSGNINDANRLGYVSYAESHDEERNMYRAKTGGTAAIKESEEVRIARVPMLVAFVTLLKGANMLWMNEELGYDYSINSTHGSSSISGDNRTSIKMRPDELGWLNPGPRMEAYRRCAQIIQLRTKLAPEVFMGKVASSQLGGGKKVRSIVWGNADDEERIVVAGNISGADPQEYTLPNGLWFDYLNDSHVLLNTVILAPGEVRIFTTKHYNLPDIHMPYDVPGDIMEVRMDEGYNLPCKFMHDGQVYIHRNGIIYDTMGRIVRK